MSRIQQQHIETLQSLFKKYARHELDCTKQKASYGGFLDVVCTCGYEDVREQVDQYSFSHRWQLLNRISKWKPWLCLFAFVTAFAWGILTGFGIVGFWTLMLW
jgi:hypothetical protein